MGYNTLVLAVCVNVVPLSDCGIEQGSKAAPGDGFVSRARNRIYGIDNMSVDFDLAGVNDPPLFFPNGRWEGV
jgi:hypothetical protein